MARLAVIGLVGKSMFFEVPHFHKGGETITAKAYYEEWGGKGFNQAVAAARQDAGVAFLGACNAADAKSIEALARQEGMTARLCAKRSPTAVASIMTDGTGETRVTVYPGAVLEVADVDQFAGSIAMADFLLLNNEVPEAVNLAALEVAKKYDVKVIFNPAPARKLPARILEGAWLFTPNEFEVGALGSVKDRCVTTLGAQGCRIEATGEVLASPSVKAVDSTGAGDTFTAVLATRLAEDDDLRTACLAANEAAAQSVTIRHVLPSLPYRKD